jgi:hypothetical protein
VTGNLTKQRVVSPIQQPGKVCVCARARARVRACVREVKSSLLYSAFNRGGNRERSVQPAQHLSRIAGVTADSGMSICTKFLSSCATGGFSRRAQLRGVMYRQSSIYEDSYYKISPM